MTKQNQNKIQQDFKSRSVRDVMPSRTGYQGLSTAQVLQLQAKFGLNELVPEKKVTFFHKIMDVITEPMFLLLMVAAIIYFVLGEPRDGLIIEYPFTNETKMMGHVWERQGQIIIAAKGSPEGLLDLCELTKVFCKG